MIEDEAYLALLTLYMSVARALTSEHSDHRLIEEMFGCMSRRKLFLVMLIEDNICIHTQIEFKYSTIVSTYIHQYEIVILEVGSHSSATQHIFSLNSLMRNAEEIKCM